MKNLSILLVMCLIGTLCVNAQKPTIPTFKTVQVRPGVIKVPSFSLPAGTSTRPDLKAILSSDLKVVTELAPGQLVGAVEVGITTSKLNIELTPKNFLAVKGAELYVLFPVLIYDKFYLGDNNDSRFTSLASNQGVLIIVDVTSGKQYLIRIPVTLSGTAARTFLISARDGNSYLNLFTTSFSGSQEIAFVLAPQNTGTIILQFLTLPAAGAWNFPKVTISEL